MSDERFTVQPWRSSLPNQIPQGFCVYDGETRITVGFETQEEAERRRENIAAIYLRYGWAGET